MYYTQKTLSLAGQIWTQRILKLWTQLLRHYILVKPNLKWKQKRELGSCQLRVDGTCFGTNLIQFEVSLNWMKSWIDPLAKTKLIPNTVI